MNSYGNQTWAAVQAGQQREREAFVLLDLPRRLAQRATAEIDCRVTLARCRLRRREREMGICLTSSITLDDG